MRKLQFTVYQENPAYQSELGNLPKTILASGDDEMSPHERFLISANGIDIEMIVINITWPPAKWVAQDYHSWEESNRLGEVMHKIGVPTLRDLQNN